MSVTLAGLAAQVHRQAVDAAVRRCAPALGVNTDEVLDSQSLCTAVRGLDPGTRAFSGEVQAAVKAAADSDRARFRNTTSAVPAPAVGKPAAGRQWTEDVSRSTPAECTAALEAGLLADLGFGPPWRRP